MTKLLLVAIHVVFASWTPRSISLKALLSDDAFATSAAEMRAELSNVGLITVSDIPSYSKLRPVLLRDAHECAKVSASSKTELFSENMVRLSMVINGHELDKSKWKSRNIFPSSNYA